jgi:Cu/Zn superoxide dismutase
VHTDPVVKGDCASAKGHYNPTNICVDPSCNYTQHCDASNIGQANCELGDLAGKHGPLTLNQGSGALPRMRYIFSDLSLPLAGPNSVVERSIVLHAADLGADRVACANLIEVKAMTATALFTVQGVTGHVRFIQPAFNAPTTLAVDLGSLDNRVHSYHVHQLPLREGLALDEVCGPDSTGGHYDPYVTMAVCNTPALTADQCEVGDLAGKHGSLSTRMTVKANYTDYNLPLFGTASVVGRSVVLHGVDGTRLACATITDDRLMEVRLFVGFIRPCHRFAAVPHLVSVSVGNRRHLYHAGRRYSTHVPTPRRPTCSNDHHR